MGSKKTILAAVSIEMMMLSGRRYQKRLKPITGGPGK